MLQAGIQAAAELKLWLPGEDRIFPTVRPFTKPLVGQSLNSAGFLEVFSAPLIAGLCTEASYAPLSPFKVSKGSLVRGSYAPLLSSGQQTLLGLDFSSSVAVLP